MIGCGSGRSADCNYGSSERPLILEAIRVLRINGAFECSVVSIDSREQCLPICSVDLFQWTFPSSCQVRDLLVDALANVRRNLLGGIRAKLA